MSQLTDKLDDLIIEASQRMNEHRIMLAALKKLSSLDPEGIGCSPSCKCMGCIARRALRFVEGDSK